LVQIRLLKNVARITSRGLKGMPLNTSGMFCVLVRLATSVLLNFRWNTWHAAL